GVDAAGLSFANGAFSLCPLNGALIAADATQNMSGGFSIRGLALNGRMSGPEGQPARLNANNVAGRFRGRTVDFTLAIEAESPRLTIEMAEQRALAVTLRRLTAGSWTAVPEDGKPVIRVNAGEALLTANRPDGEDDRPLFNPLRIVEASALVQDGEISALGAIVLDDRGRQLAHFNARHRIEDGAGIATVNAERIEFGPGLQPFEITEQARGLVENVRGPMSASADITWTRTDLLGTGIVRLDGISLSTATIPILNDVRGEVHFDDLWTLTTPPGQHVTIGELNPGVAVQNGRVNFQLLTDERVSIESAEFDFASGTLAMRPTTITLGADETRFELTLRDVEAAALLSTLNVRDITASGQLEGSFPLLLTRRSAFVEHGVIRAQGDGGVLSYTGEAGQSATGISRIAFDALRSFEYDQLSLTIDGDLNGDVVSSIDFSGHNSGRPVDLGPITPIPGIGRVTVRGVPFDFNVRITAPFSRLAQTAATITDPGALIRQGQAPQAQEPVDPDAPTPR
ncbi:MAG: YdbH domain-containing protein, partial [Terricaulis sp.]